MMDVIYGVRRHRCRPPRAHGVFDFFGAILSCWLSDRCNSHAPIPVLRPAGALARLSAFLWFRRGPARRVRSLLRTGLGRDRPPTVKLTSEAFGPARASVVFGWIFAAHQPGAGFAALMVASSAPNSAPMSSPSRMRDFSVSSLRGSADRQSPQDSTRERRRTSISEISRPVCT